MMALLKWFYVKAFGALCVGYLFLVATLVAAVFIETSTGTSIGYFLVAMTSAYGGFQALKKGLKWSSMDSVESKEPTSTPSLDLTPAKTVETVDAQSQIKVEREVYIVLDADGNELRRMTKVVDTQAQPKRESQPKAKTA